MYSQDSLTNRRAKSDVMAASTHNSRLDRSSIDRSPESVYGNARRSLRPLPQAPSSSPPSTKRESHQHSHNHSFGDFSSDYADDPLVEKHHAPQENSYQLPERPRVTHAHTIQHPSQLIPTNLEELNKSSTGYLKTLSKYAKTSESDDFSITAPAPSVAGLHGRRQLKRTDSTVGSQGKAGVVNGDRYGWSDRNWMDKQRQFLQAYEYLCHIGEAKEWIEDIIHKPIPPIVQLEEALRDGVTLAEIVQALNPHRPMRIFRHHKLQFRHSDNIALFFRFLEDAGLPDLFRFELIDLYEKKNIPKVIYCIHALSWLLFRKGIVDFRIGNLVGQLQFEHHELEQMQKGLDKAGISMPSFSGMGASFGAEPEPEPVESEEDRVNRELGEREEIITDFQAQARGAVQRLKLGHTMSGLWDSEVKLMELQALIRGDWARQVIRYRLDMQRFAVSLQAAVRGFIARNRQYRKEQFWKAREGDILKLQSLARATRKRTNLQKLKIRARQEATPVTWFQAAVRGALTRKAFAEQFEATKDEEDVVRALQAISRGFIARKTLKRDQTQLVRESSAIVRLQAAARGLSARSATDSTTQSLERLSGVWRALQAVGRGKIVRDNTQGSRNALAEQRDVTSQIQATIRGAAIRNEVSSLKQNLELETNSIIQAQNALRGFILRHNVALDQGALEKEEESLINLQSFCRGAIERRQIGATLSSLEDSEEKIAHLQAFARAMLLRDQVGQVLSELEGAEDSIVAFQAAIRASTVRTRFEEKKRYFNENMKKVVKIQSIVRAKIQGEAYKSLTSGKNPPVGTLKGFVHLLNDSDFDFDEEIEFERLRKAVVQHVRQNELADQYITQLDIKIALLVKNKITLDEVIKHQRHFGGHVGSLLPNTDISSKDPFDLKALNKTSRRKLEHYQGLFFLLQTQPQYLSRLFRRIREQATPEKECERIKHVMMGLFGYAQKRREEYYLVKLIVRSIKEEVDQAHSLQDYLRCSSFWNRIFGAYAKSPRDRKFMRDILGSIVKENVIDNPHLDLESDPLQIYLSAISNEELRTGQRSRRNPNVPREVAIKDQETRETFIQHLQELRDIADQFFAMMENMLHRMPFGVRFIGQQMYGNLLDRFPDEDPGFVLQLVGQWMWRNYLQPALTEPEKFGVIDRALTQEQKRNLGEIAKVLNQVASGREFAGDNVYLQPLNTYVRESIYRLLDIWNHMIAVPPAEEHYDIDEFNDLYAKTKPTLYVKMSDIFSLHQLVTTEIASVCPNQDDVLRDIMRELGSVKSNENELMSVGSTEICLTLNPKLHNAEDPEADVKALFMETKRCVLYIIRIQSGESLLDILVKPISPEDEDKWEALVRDELHSVSGRRGAYSEANTAIDLGSLTYGELKQMALENVLQLQNIGKLSANNHYQDLLNAIAVDIRTKHRRRIQRQRELEGVRTTLARLNEQASYLEGQLKTYNDYIEQAMVTLQSKKGKKRFLMPFTKQWDHERELQRSGRSFKFGSYKYSARNLADRGVLVHWRGYTERQWDRVDLTISSNEVGVFMIDGSSGNMMVPGANAQVPLDDLLQAQFNNTQFIDFFEGALRVNVNLFLHLIMKKFYNE
ncbi:MAG: hypothetical protein Q9160_006436 [Pyrenula sp. 1 TL-2023]